MFKRNFHLVCIITLCSFLYSLDIKELPDLISLSPEMEKKKIELKQAETGIDYQIYEYFPDLSIKYEGNYDNFLEDDYGLTQSLALVTTWDLFDSWNQVGENMIERLEYEGLLLEYESVFQEEIYATAEIYFEALENREQYELALSSEELSRKQYEYTEVKFNQGSVSELELLTSKADYDDSRYQSAYYKTAYDNSLSELSRELDIDIQEVNDVVQKKMEKLTKDSLSSIIKRDYELLMAENTVHINRISKKLASKNRWFPSVSVSSAVDWGSLYKERGSSWKDDSIDPSLTIAVEIPVYEKNEKLLEIKKADLVIKSSQINYKDIEKRNARLLMEYISDYNNKVELLNISELRVESTKKTYEMTEKSYKLGIKSQLEFFESENSFNEAMKDYIVNYYDIQMMLLKIGRLIGNTLILL